MDIILGKVICLVVDQVNTYISLVLRVCHKPHPIRPERAEALSPGQRPGF